MTLIPLRRRHGAGETPAVDRLRQTDAYAEAVRDAGFSYVCLIGHAQAVPRYIGDNQGGRAAKIIVSAKLDGAHKRDNQSIAYEGHAYHVLAHVCVASDAHGRRLKGLLDKQLLGDAEQARLLYSWREIGDADVDVLWGVILDTALRHAEEAGNPIEIFSAEEQESIFLRLAQQRLGGRRR